MKRVFFWIAGIFLGCGYQLQHFTIDTLKVNNTFIKKLSLHTPQNDTLHTRLVPLFFTLLVQSFSHINLTSVDEADASLKSKLLNIQSVPVAFTPIRSVYPEATFSADFLATLLYQVAVRVLFELEDKNSNVLWRVYLKKSSYYTNSHQGGFLGGTIASIQQTELEKAALRVLEHCVEDVKDELTNFF